MLLTLGDYPPHALIGGPSGTGKTNLIFAWIGALAARYSPAELEFYLLDFKEGVSFARFAQGRRDPSWLPHMRLVGINVNTDREFGLALLRFLAEELRRRADAAKKHEVTKLAELRAVDPTGHWPRIVAVVDEFQMLLAGRDVVAREAADLLEDLARRGRSQGIHLVLASQDVRGIEALWGRPALVAQFTLRIALPKALRILAERNDAAQSLPRHHAVVNAESGMAEGNEVARIPSASDWETWSELAAPAVADAPAGRGAGPALRRRRDPPAGRRPGLPGARRAAGRARAAQPGGPARRDHRRAVPLGGAAAAPRARAATWRCWAPGSTRRARCWTPPPGRWPASTAPGTARFSIACLDPDADPAARALYDDLADDAAWYDEETVPRADGRDGRRADRPGPAARTTCCCSPSTRRPARWPRGPVGVPGWSSCAGSCTTGRNGVPTCWPGGGEWPGCGPTWAGRPPAPTRSAPGWRWTCTAASWARRSIRAPAARTGIPARGGGSSSTGRCTAPDR